MDLNYLRHRHQVSLFMAQSAASEPAREAHRGLAKAYAAEIASVRFERRPECAE
jgi:hypothetical protein